MLQNAYLILPKLLIKKSDVGDLLGTYDRVEFKKAHNKKLYDPTVIRVTPSVLLPMSCIANIRIACARHAHLDIGFLHGAQH